MHRISTVLVLFLSVLAPLSWAAESELCYVNPGGEAYHRTGCRFIKPGARALPLKEAFALATEHRPCRTCQPPTPPAEPITPATSASIAPKPVEPVPTPVSPLIEGGKEAGEGNRVIPTTIQSPTVSVQANQSDQEILDNGAILRLVRAGLGEDVIVGMIGQRPGKYSLATDDVVALKGAGVTDKVITAMVGKNAAPPPPATATAPTNSQEPLVLHDSTPVKLRLTRNLSSADAKVGDTVDFEVLEDVKVGDTLVIARGETAIATVTKAQHKRRMGRGGKLDVNIDYVRLVNGEKVALRAVRETKGGGHTGSMTGGIVATSIVFFPAAPFFLFMHGKDITIPKGTEITAYVNGEVTLNREKFTAK